MSVSSGLMGVDAVGRGVPIKVTLLGIVGGDDSGKFSSVVVRGNFATEFDLVGGIISGIGTKKY